VGLWGEGPLGFQHDRSRGLWGAPLRPTTAEDRLGAQMDSLVQAPRVGPR